MDTLPLKLKQRVCSYLTPKDLKSLRLTSKVYSVAACRYLLPRIFLFNHPDSFQELQDIIKHPDMKNSVTTLVVDLSCLPLCPKFEQWARLCANTRLHLVDQSSLPRVEDATKKSDLRTERFLRRETNREKWLSYQEMARAQRAYSTKESMLDSIALAFQEFPKLTNLIIECHSSEGTISAMVKRRARYYHDIPLEGPTFSKHSYEVRGSRWESMQLTVWDLFKPVHDANRALTSLVMLDARLVWPKDWNFPTTAIFHDLKHLRHQRCSGKLLDSIVTCSPKLESFGAPGHYDPFYDPSQKFMGKVPLRNFRTFGMNRITTKEDDLVRCLLNQSNTLQHLSIVFGYPEHSINWHSFATRVKGQLTNLRRVCFSNLPRQYSPWPMAIIRIRVPQQAEYITDEDILQDNEHELETGPMEIEDGLWEDYEQMFFPKTAKP